MLSSLPKEILIAIRLTIVFGLATGIIYPLAITGVAQVVFNDQSNGSLLKDKNGTVVGSKLIGQWFDPADLKYFHPRPSATVDPNTGAALPYAANNSTGSNYGPSNQNLISRVASSARTLQTQYTIPSNGIPVDMVTTSFSGLDPDISIANAMIQADTVAKARGLDPAKVRALVDKYTQGRILWVFGEPHVNVLLIDMALDNGEAG
jgi:potassium-transporting ATPase KdpC subunit